MEVDILAELLSRLGPIDPIIAAGVYLFWRFGQQVDKRMSVIEEKLRTMEQKNTAEHTRTSEKMDHVEKDLHDVKEDVHHVREDLSGVKAKVDLMGPQGKISQR